MEPASPREKKLKSPDVSLNVKNCITCSNVPEGLLEANAAKKHFSKFGRVHRIRLFIKRKMCMIEYDQKASVEKAVLNAGAFDGFMFDVVRTKPRIRRRSSRKEDDPDWLPDEDVKGELAAMRGAPTYRVTRQKPMDLEESKPLTSSKRIIPKKTLPPITVPPKVAVSQPPPAMEAAAVAAQPTTLSTSEAAAELVQLRGKISLTADEQWRTLDARDRILRAWGGAGARPRVGGAVLGTCRDMCPEKERLMRQSEHQVMLLESVPGTDGQLDPQRAVKQYSRSSADQEMPMCYELRPASVLRMTCSYLLTDLADTTQVSLADWFHFMWDRFRGIRKDITQQALCCAESIRLVEMCARFHAHCAARLAHLAHAQFDPKLNTDNLTKCLQTLKHMYADAGAAARPREAEFRGYIALLNLGDYNFWWEIKQLPEEIQKSEPIIFAMKVFNALDNNNYVRFFRLVRERATYLQACILLRYFNDVRARGLARIVKAYAPRGGSKYPARELINSLAFETHDTMRSFINHYGLRCAKTDDEEPTVILDRNQFIEDSDPYPLAREPSLIESKRQSTVGQVIAGGEAMSRDYETHVLCSSFDNNGVLKESCLTAEDLGYSTLNDTNRDLNTLKSEMQRLSQGNRSFSNEKSNLFVKQGPRSASPKPPTKLSAPQNISKQFSFKPAIPVASIEVINTSPEKIFGTDTKSTFSFSKPAETGPSSVWTNDKDTKNLFKTDTGARSSLFSENANTQVTPTFSKPTIESKNAFQSSQNLFKGTTSVETNVFAKKAEVKYAFGSTSSEKENRSLFAAPPTKPTNNLFASASAPTNIFTKKTEAPESKPVAASIFGKTENSLFPKPDAPKLGGNLFSKPAATEADPKSIFGSVRTGSVKPSIFGLESNSQDGAKIKSLFTANNGDVATNKLSPGTLFKSVAATSNGTDPSYTIFQSKNQTTHNSVATNIFNSINAQKTDDVYNFVDNQDEVLQKEVEKKQREEEERLRRQEELRIEQERKQALARQEEERRLEEMRKKQDEEKRLQELKRRKKEEQRKQEELKRKLEEERIKAEQARKAQEEERFRERVNKESTDLIEDLLNEVNIETVVELLKREMEKMKSLMSFADEVHMDILINLCNEICTAEAMAEKFLTEKLMRKWFTVWRQHFMRNAKRRSLLDNTPVWIPEHTPDEAASFLRRLVEKTTLKSMNAFHKGHRFTGEAKVHPAPDPYKIMEVIKSSLLKRMNQIRYPYDKCFFWKLTLVSPGSRKWLSRKVQIEKWLLDAFSDKKTHDVSDSLIHVGRQSWNNLMNFAISVSLANKDNTDNYNEALEGTNGLLFYASEDDYNLMETIEKTIKQKYPYQVIPVAIIMPKLKVDALNKKLETFLNYLKDNNSISCFRILTVNPDCVHDSLYAVTKSAMKWLAKNYPIIPPLEIDCLKSLCQRYLANEIWCKLRLERESHLRHILRDLNKLVKIYNVAVDKLTAAITNEDLFNYPSFPLEFKPYLNEHSPYPKPIEFITSNVKTSENVSAIKDMMKVLRLPEPNMEFQPMCVTRMHDDIRTYCNQIGWFKDPEEVVCKVVALLPTEFSNVNLPSEQFSQCFERYNMLDILNIIVYEKINSLNTFDNRYAIYEREALEAYRIFDWIYETDVVSNMKHRPLEYDDELDYVIGAKRRKIAHDSLEYLMLEDKDMTIVEENITTTADKINQYSHCHAAMKQLEDQLDEEGKRSVELENLLRMALGDD